MKEKLAKEDNFHKWILAATIIVVVFIAMAVTQKTKYLSLGFLKNTTSSLETSPTFKVQMTQPKAMTQPDYINKSLDDLAGKLKIDKTLIIVVNSDEYNWNNASLGCPQKGVLYAQIIIPGFTIDLSYNNTAYSYHAGSNRVVSCQN